MAVTVEVPGAEPGRALPDDLKAIVAEGFEMLKAATRALPKERQEEAIQRFRAAGGEIITPTPEARAEFRAAASGMREWFAKTYGREWLDRLDAAVAACSPAEPG